MMYEETMVITKYMSLKNRDKSPDQLKRRALDPVFYTTRLVVGLALYVADEMSGLRRRLDEAIAGTREW